MKYLVLDIETRDEYIGMGLGSGGVYKYHNLPYSDTMFKLLGVAYRDYEGNMGYTESLQKVQQLICTHDTIIGHNLRYDIQGLLAYNIELHNKPLLDTMIMGKLLNSSLHSHSLDALCQRYLNTNKTSGTLADEVFRLDIYPYFKYELAEKKRCEKKGVPFVRQKPDPRKLEKWCKENMDVIQAASFKTIARYAVNDVYLTYQLFEYISTRVDMNVAYKYSHLVHICIDYRFRGIRVDLDKARENRQELIPLTKKLYERCYELAGEEFDIFSVQSVASVLDKFSIRYNTTAKGNPSVTKDFLENSGYDLCQAIADARKCIKIDRDFIQKTIEMQEYTDKDQGEGKYGRVFPELKVMSAKTGRFSCEAPNFQQQPARHPEFGAMVRSMFVPEDGQLWYSIDYKSQELLVALHYANRLGCTGAKEAVEEFCNDTSIDLHQRTADLVGCSRTQAKTIGLGILYGMGKQKLADSLGTNLEEAKKILSKFNKQVPYFKELSDECKDKILDRGAIKSLNGRFLTLERAITESGERISFEHKACNLLIQGSSCDMMVNTMMKCYKENIPLLLSIHDEIVLSGTYEQAERARQLMQDVQLDVPVIAEMGQGGTNFHTGGH